MASRLLYAIQLAQNSINRIQPPEPDELVTDYLAGHFGDIVALAEAGTESSAAPSDDDVSLLSDFEISHSGRGDTGWQPTNADYPDHPAQELVAQEPADKEPPPTSAPPKPGPPIAEPPKPGPWDNPLLDHIVHQLNSGMSEHEVAVQLTRDIQANKVALSS